MSNALYHQNTEDVSFLANEVLCDFKIIDNLSKLIAFKLSSPIESCLLNLFFPLPMYVSDF